MVSNKKSNGGRVPSLDGLRAISVIFVIFDHLCISRSIPFHQTIIDFGNLGVRIFFVISGFIISRLLLEEKEKTGDISLRSFYIRRCFRILPIWLVYLVMISIVLAFTKHTPPALDMIAVLTYNADYINPVTIDLNHLWSLSVEEKFYVVWPMIITFTRKRTAIILAMVTMIGVPFLRMLELYNGASYEKLLWPFHTTADAIATGCLLALLNPWLKIDERWRMFIRSHAVWCIPLVVLIISAMSKSGILYWLVGITVLNLAIAVGIDAVVSHPESAVGRLLNSRPFIIIGSWSYGLYLWQQPLTFHRKAGMISVFPVNVALLFVVAGLGYYFVEKPSQDYGRNLCKRL
jgi:peptidoglycan/LPS O-acetylase OafA/YrhL